MFVLFFVVVLLFLLVVGGGGVASVHPSWSYFFISLLKHNYANIMSSIN